MARRQHGRVKSKDEYQQLWSGSWYKLDQSYHHMCCNDKCGLVHKVDYKLENGVMFQRWTVDAKETAKARRKARKGAKQNAR